MMIIKTRIQRDISASTEVYINLPVTDRTTSSIDIKNGVFHISNEPKVIGVVTGAEDVGAQEIELTISLWGSGLQRECIQDGSEIQPISFSMGIE